MKNDERSKFANSDKKKVKEAVPVRKLSLDTLNRQNSKTKPRPRISKQLDYSPNLRTVHLMPNKIPKPNTSTSNRSIKNGLPLTVPDRNKQSTQNIFNIIFNNSNVNIQNNNDNGFRTSNNYVVINTNGNDGENIIPLVVKSEEHKKYNDMRADRRGIPIVKRGRKHEVSFLDRVEPNKRLVEIFNVESYKQYNYENSYGEKGKKVSCNASLACCLII
jgi:hypothetical protein